MSLTHRTPVTTNGHRRPVLIVRFTKRRLSRRVLRSLAGSLESDLFALFLASVPGQELGGLEGRPKFFVGADQDTGNTVPDRTGLAGCSATGDRCNHIESLGSAGHPEWLGHDEVMELAATEVLADRLAVN